VLALAIAAVLSLAACGGGGGGEEQSPTPKSTEGVTADDLPSMALAADDLPEDLAGFTVTEAKAVPNEVKANTGGGDEPVTLDDPDYRQNLAQLNSWGRQGGYSVTFTREEQGGVPTDIWIELDIAQTEAGAHQLFVGWYEPQDASECSILDAADESACSPGLDLLSSKTLAPGEVEQLGLFQAQFRTGRIVGSVSVITVPPPTVHPEELARLLFDKIQERL
jgi:hypothetical protein